MKHINTIATRKHTYLAWLQKSEKIMNENHSKWSFDGNSKDPLIYSHSCYHQHKVSLSLTGHKDPMYVFIGSRSCQGKDSCSSGLFIRRLVGITVDMPIFSTQRFKEIRSEKRQREAERSTRQRWMRSIESQQINSDRLHWPSLIYRLPWTWRTGGNWSRSCSWAVLENK